MDGDPTCKYGYALPQQHSYVLQQQGLPSQPHPGYASQPLAYGPQPLIYAPLQQGFVLQQPCFPPQQAAVLHQAQQVEQPDPLAHNPLLRMKRLREADRHQQELLFAVMAHRQRQVTFMRRQAAAVAWATSAMPQQTAQRLQRAGFEQQWQQLDAAWQQARAAEQEAWRRMRAEQWHDLLEIWEEQEVSWQRFMHNESLQWQQKKAGFQEQWAAVARRVEMHQGQPAAAPAPCAAAAGETGPAQVHLQQGDTTAAEPAPGPAGPQPMQAAAAAAQVGPAGATAAQPMQAEGRSAEEGPAPVAAQLEASHSAEGPHPAVRLPHAVLPAAQPMRLRRQALAAGKRRRAEAGGEGDQDELAGAEQSASSAVPLDSGAWPLPLAALDPADFLSIAGFTPAAALPTGHPTTGPA